MVVGAGVIVRNGRGYVPTQGQFEDGPYVDIAPVHEVKLCVADIVQALEIVIAAGHPRVPAPTQEEWRKRRDPVLEAAGVRSWKELAKGGATYTIYWQGETVALFASRLDRRGRFEVDPAKTLTFPKDALLSTIAEAILDDVRSRPDLLDAE